MLLLDTETIWDYYCILEIYRNQNFPGNKTSLTYQKLVRTFHQSSMLALREGNLTLNTNRNASTVRAIKQWNSETATNESLSLMSFKDTTGQVVACALDTVVAGQEWVKSLFLFWWLWYQETASIVHYSQTLCPSGRNLALVAHREWTADHW